MRAATGRPQTDAELLIFFPAPASAARVQSSDAAIEHSPVTAWKLQDDVRPHLSHFVDIYWREFEYIARGPRMSGKRQGGRTIGRRVPCV